MRHLEEVNTKKIRVQEEISLRKADCKQSVAEFRRSLEMEHKLELLRLDMDTQTYISIGDSASILTL